MSLYINPKILIVIKKDAGFCSLSDYLIADEPAEGSGYEIS